ncbi:MAG TPA: excinuclease ABC subunit UvrA [Terriglobales bacterium]|nr:excinuclease ABC subunit UvrA [Terriglobales bacterium]
MSASLSNQVVSSGVIASYPGDSIVVRGARTHNLKNIDFEVPHNAMTVVTGVSGSGKSSLAFDTIYAEGQRRYVESLSAYARQFLERIEKPDADHIEGIAPAVAIRQKNTTRSPRSTVATATEIYDYLRLLYARVGRTYCINCGTQVKKDNVDEVAEAVLALSEGTRLNVLFPLLNKNNTQSDVIPSPPEAGEEPAVPKPRPGRRRQAERSLLGMTRGKKKKNVEGASLDTLKTRLFDLRQKGFNRLFQNGQVFEFSTPESLLDVNFAEPVFVLVDRIAVSADSRARIVDATEISFREGGEAIFETAPSDGERSRILRFSQRFECKKCGLRCEEPEPRLFSFNNPYGACPRCQGFGNTIDFDLTLVVPDPSKTLNEGAIEPWTKPKGRPWFTELKRFAKPAGIPLDVPWAELSPEHRRLVIEGERRFPGIRGFFQYLERKKYKLHVRVFLSRYRGYSTCSECGGARLRREARQVKIAGKNICEVCSMTVEEAAAFFERLEACSPENKQAAPEALVRGRADEGFHPYTPMGGDDPLSREEAGIAEKLLQEIRSRLRFLNDVGLEYLMLDRLTSTLSGGEAQRIQLATSLGSRLVGTLYVLDEPSIGLHSRDTHRLINILHGLRDLGNTVLVVEHDPDVMRASDYILDLGPGAGEHGGKVTASGTYEQIQKAPASLTGRYLANELRIPVPTNRRKPGKQQITIRGARAHNLKNLDVTIPLGMLVAITGVSGSGKSTLLHDVLFRALSALKKRTENGQFPSSFAVGRPGFPYLRELEGTGWIDDVVLVDQSPIGRTPRSNPVTYIKAFDGIRELFAGTPEAHKRGFLAGHFSFNVPGGRCETCQGDGTVAVEMQFLADVELICEECKGTRFKPEVLEVRYRGKNIHEALNLTVREAMQHFAGAPKVADRLRMLDEVGLGYLRLGQSATTLSGGEAQRVKLAAHLQPAGTRSGDGSSRRPRLLYIFDEPTTGLHFDDISKLLSAFRRLIEAGGSILLIEHNLEVIKTADWVIDLGPEGGDRGGRIVGTGTPETIARIPGSHTGEFLARVLRNGDSRSNGRH